MFATGVKAATTHSWALFWYRLHRPRLWARRMSNRWVCSGSAFR